MTEIETAKTREIVAEFMRRYGGGDMAGAAELFAENLDFRIPGAAGVPWVGTRSTRAELAEFLQIMVKELEGRSFQVHHVLCDGGEAVIVAHVVSIVRATGLPFETAFALHLSVSEGQITRYHLYDDTHAAAKAFSAL